MTTFETITLMEDVTITELLLTIMHDDDLLEWLYVFCDEPDILFTMKGRRYRLFKHTAPNSELITGYDVVNDFTGEVLLTVDWTEYEVSYCHGDNFNMFEMVKAGTTCSYGGEIKHE